MELPRSADDKRCAGDSLSRYRQQTDATRVRGEEDSIPQCSCEGLLTGNLQDPGSRDNKASGTQGVELDSACSLRRDACGSGSVDDVELDCDDEDWESTSDEGSLDEVREEWDDFLAVARERRRACFGEEEEGEVSSVLDGEVKDKLLELGRTVPGCAQDQSVESILANAIEYLKEMQKGADDNKRSRTVRDLEDGKLTSRLSL